MSTHRIRPFLFASYHANKLFRSFTLSTSSAGAHGFRQIVIIDAGSKQNSFKRKVILKMY